MLEKSIKLFFLAAVLQLSSCFLLLPGNLTDNAYYDLNDASVRLVVKHPNDTLYKTQYEINNNLPGNIFPLLSSTYSIDTASRLGIQLKLWAAIVMKNEGTFYGPYPKNGLLNKVDKIQIILKNNSSQLELSPYLHGDSTLKKIMWRKYEYKKTPYTWGQALNCPDIATMIQWLNDGSKLNNIPRHDYIFWFDKSVWKKMDFQPTKIVLHMTLVDTNRKFNKILRDSIALK